MKLLLTSVFGPFGLDDKFGKKENKMELFHNQITREQGIFSYRFNHNSFGLYLLAENINVPTTLLDFPGLRKFISEIKKNYEYIGISFIIPNFNKAKHMVTLIKKYSPKSKIILGGHGVAHPNIDKLLEHDFICKGDGIPFLRELFGENPNKRIKHPLVYSSFNRNVMGVPLPKTSGVLMPGLGCPNKCRFCCTSSFFNGYKAFLETGRDIYEVCCEYEEKLGVTDFGVLEENFLKEKGRALELLKLIEENNKKFTFGIFSSAEAISSFNDLDILVRLGVQLIWIGVESKTELYEKNRGIDLKTLFNELQKRGISVLASSILFLEHHTRETIWDDINFAVSLKSDYLQFMELGPMPGTPLYQDYDSKGILYKDISPEEKHGQDKIWFKHNCFSRNDSSVLLKKAFLYDYRKNGASILRAFNTALRGYEYVKTHKLENVRARATNYYNQINQLRYFLLSISLFSENSATKELVRSIKLSSFTTFGKMKFKNLLLSLIVTAFTLKSFLKAKIFNDNRHPGCFKKKFNFHEKHKGINTGVVQIKAFKLQEK